jgi:hypothetical protein
MFHTETYCMPRLETFGLQFGKVGS